MKIGTVLLMWFLGVKRRPQKTVVKNGNRDWHLMTPVNTRWHSASIRNSCESGGYSVNCCHAVLRIRAQQGHLKESQMTCNEPFGFFRFLLNLNPQGLSPAGETVPSRWHNQTASESEKDTSKRCRSRLLFGVTWLFGNEDLLGSPEAEKFLSSSNY